MESQVKFCHPGNVFLELHSKTVPQHSPKQMKQMGTFFNKYISKHKKAPHVLPGIIQDPNPIRKDIIYTLLKAEILTLATRLLSVSMFPI